LKIISIYPCADSAGVRVRIYIPQLAEQKMAEIYVSTENYRRAAEAIAALEPCPFQGRITADQVKIALGEVGNIWPASSQARTHQ
jgi:hypothetical protein